MPDIADASSAMDVEADIVIDHQLGIAGVQAHPDAHARTIGPGFIMQEPLCLDGRRDRDCRMTEDSEVRIGMRVHLQPALAAGGHSQQLEVPVEHFAIAFAEGFDESRRALDIREQEGQVAGRKSAVPGRSCGLHIAYAGNRRNRCPSLGQATR